MSRLESETRTECPIPFLEKVCPCNDVIPDTVGQKAEGSVLMGKFAMHTGTAFRCVNHSSAAFDSSWQLRLVTYIDKAQPPDIYILLHRFYEALHQLYQVVVTKLAALLWVPWESPNVDACR